MSGLIARITSSDRNNIGPAGFNTRYRMGDDTPKWTIKNRYSQNVETLDPALVNLPSTVGEGPKHSLSGRPTERISTDTPGPNYIPPQIGHDAPKASLAGRTGTDKYNTNPGPGTYNIGSGRSGPSYTLKGRTEIRASHDGPGPAAYYPDYTVTKKSSRKSTMHIRPKDPQPRDSVGYYKLPSTLGGPRFTIGNRETLDLIMV